MDRVYQVELEIVYLMQPSLLNNSQNSLQGCTTRLAKSVIVIVIVVVSELSVDCNLEALYLSVFDFEYRT